MRKDCHNCKYDDEDYDYEGEFAVSPCVSCTSKYDEPPTNWKAKEEVGVEMIPEESLICVYNKETNMFEEYQEPFAIIECPTEKEYKLIEVAIEKQIPKEPAIETKQGMTLQKCPECGRVLFSDKYCGDCGQLIKR